MDFWFVALRGEEDALVEARATLGAPVAWFETLQLFSFEAVDPRNAAMWVSSIAQTQGLAGAVVLSGDDARAAREKALALACAAPDGTLLFEHDARVRLDGDLIFERAASRDGWTIPVEAVALARDKCRRADARLAVAKIAADLPLIGRDTEVDGLVRMLGAPDPVWLVADEGAGAGRLLSEAARKAEKLFARIPARAMQSEALLDAAIADAVGDWIVLDPIGPEHLPQVKAIASRFPRVRRLVVRAPRNIGIEFIGPARQFVLPPLTTADSREIARALLGERVGDPWIRRVARRGRGLPGQIVEVARAAVQLGHITWDGEAFVPRVHRVLNRRGTTGDAIDDRVRDVPDRVRRALAVIATLGDGAPEIASSAALRGTMTSRPDEFTTQLLALRLVHVRDAQIWIDGSVRRFLPPSDVAADTLIEKGVLPSASEAEHLLSVGKLRDAGSLFVEAAAMALEAGLSAAAVRFIAAALPNGGRETALPDELIGAVKTIARTLGPALVVEPEGGHAGHAGRAMDPDALDQAAAQALERNDLVGAERLRALAEVVRGNTQNALRITGRHSTDGSSKSQLVSAIAQASAGEMRVAVRTALRALIMARRVSDRSGEAAALAVLSSMYKAAGREEDAKRLAAGAKHLQQAS